MDIFLRNKVIMEITVIDYREQCKFRPVDTFSCRRLSGDLSLRQVLAYLNELRQVDPSHRYLCTLDDLNQCCYTSGYAGNDKRIEMDCSDTNFDNYESVRRFEAHRLAHVVEQLQDPRLREAWEDVCGTLATSADNVAALAGMNRDPDQVLDNVVYVQRLAVPEDDLLIAGLPNGYFTCDWNVFQNHAVIRHMRERHGYRFFGIGASWLGFVRERPMSKKNADELITDLVYLYGCGEADAQAAWQELARIVETEKVLLLGYTENLSE